MYDVIIIGTGIAGLSCALKLTENNSDLKIACLTKNTVNNCNTRLAQGGIACVKSKIDSFENHINDTLKASNYTSQKNIVEMVVKSANKCISDLEKWGVKFDKKTKESYDLGLEGGHSLNRIVHVADHTGIHIHKQLLKEIKKHKNIEILAFHEVNEIIRNRNTVSGLKAFLKKEKIHKTIHASQIVIATGGIGSFFKQTTNSYYSNGEGLALASILGLKIKNLKSIQFHPSAFFQENKKKLFLISEAVRGAGAQVVNLKKERFLLNYDSRGELATRDILSSAIYHEMKSSKQKCVFMDLSKIKNFNLEFPSIHTFLRKQNLNWENDLIPIVPAAHYQCGGIEVDKNGCTSLKNLYAIGECSETGLHGTNRLASNSLLEAFVFAENCAKHICVQKMNKISLTTDNYQLDTFCNTQSIAHSISNLQNQLLELCQKNDFDDKFKELKETILNKMAKNKKSIGLIRLKNKLEVLRLIANSF